MTRTQDMGFLLSLANFPFFFDCYDKIF